MTASLFSTSTSSVSSSTQIIMCRICSNTQVHPPPSFTRRNTITNLCATNCEVIVKIMPVGGVVQFAVVERFFVFFFYSRVVVIVDYLLYTEWNIIMHIRASGGFPVTAAAFAPFTHSTHTHTLTHIHTNPLRWNVKWGGGGVCVFVWSSSFIKRNSCTQHQCMEGSIVC